ncbi:MAG: anthranilate phosphoribosyltransferase [Clostridiales bacterium]|jgi:anthranilate phosphoribosyltransferase|nr:anthranilate phosphoribosyltransferase [Clostridiales bacterium]
MITKAIHTLVSGGDLSVDLTKQAFGDILSGKATDAQIASFITALRIKGETIDEITACAAVMREKSITIRPTIDVLDIVGTGGDYADTFNVSTVASFVISAGGTAVAKHGNRSVSSKCGSADVLEALGVNIEVSPEKSERLLHEIGLCFLYAPLYHSSMKYAMPARKQLGMRTIFNILGPLSSPAAANLCLVGVYDEALVTPLAMVLKNLGVKRAMVVCGHDGLDEISLSTSTTVCEVNNGAVNSFFLNPRQLGLPLCDPAELKGGGIARNKAIALDILSGKKDAKRNMVVLNAAVCLYMAQSDSTLRDCVKLAENLIDSGKAMAKLNEFISRSNEEVCL